MADITYPCFIARLDGRGHWHWTYYLHEDQPVARSQEKYIAQDDCERAIRAVQASAGGPVYFLGI